MKRIVLLITIVFMCISIEAQKRNTEIVEQTPASDTHVGKVIKRKVAIGRFSNETQYAKGIFYDKENDPMGKQALDILSSKLAASSL